MVYDIEAVMPTDLQYDSTRLVNYTEASNKVTRQNRPNIFDEARNLACSRMTIYQHGLHWYHSLRVHTHTFQEGDLVLRLILDKKGHAQALSTITRAIRHRASARQ
jgi:hypothetical protein